MKQSFIIIGLYFLVVSCKVTTHSVPDIQGSRIVEKKDHSNYYLFQTKLQRPIAKSWFKKYLGLNREDDLVKSKVVLFPELEKEFLITVTIKDDREEYMDIPIAEKLFDGILGINEDDQSSKRKDKKDNTGPVKFFVNIQISDKDGVDHISTSSLYSSRVRNYLRQLENDFFEYQKNFKALS
ncbi:hypothetical protein [Zunongwangia pacifica]|uniref:Uncharacterized protein n=1 Tax=Zunongwangia pacifica TaxID=2911062 RepID=A0A9X1ZZ36_9FLAO|nr:hypothetical protein [Zunongwangia pacifica]MCL6217099.1 hypothetical protein [Zunongwangia pacifica]